MEGDCAPRRRRGAGRLGAWSTPPEIAALRAALAAAEARADAIAAEAAHAKAVLSGSEALIARLRLEIETLRRALHGHRSERKERLLDQLELQLEELEAARSEERRVGKECV